MPSRRSKIESASSAATTATAAKILVAEDADDLRDAIVLVLLEQGYRVQAARDGHEATLLFTEFNPDLVVLDMNMPKMSGPSAAAVIRQSSSVPIIMFTSTNDAEEVRDAIRKGATDFILKSTGVSELTDRIEFHLNKQETENAPAVRSAIQTIPAPKPVVAAPKKLVTTSLIVDADATSRNIIKAVLTRLNQTVIEANNASEAIAAFKQHDPDIVITEWKLPDMDAFKMLSELKRGRNAKELLKLLMSARVSPEAHRKANYVGITNFLYKPLNAAKVEPMIADCVRKSIHGLRRRQKAA